MGALDRIPVIDLAPLSDPTGAGIDRLCADILATYGTLVSAIWSTTA
jgi:hypothetical protein